MGVAGLAAFLWSMRSGQYEDLDGAAERVLVSDAADVPLRQYGWKSEAAAHEARPKGGKAPTADGVFFKEQNGRKGLTMSQAGDRPYDWVAALAFYSGAAVLVPSLAALVVSLLAVALALL